MKPFRDEGPLYDYDRICQRVRSQNFLGYAVVNWGTHVNSSVESRTVELGRSLLVDERAGMAAWQALTLNTLGMEDDFSGLEWPIHWHIELWGAAFEVSIKPVGTTQFAANLGISVLVAILLEEGADPDETRGINTTALYWAVINKHNEMLNLLLQRGADPNSQHDKHQIRRWRQNTIGACFDLPLGIATRTDNIDAMELLLRYGANVNQRMRDPWFGGTVLLMALSSHRDGATKYLLANGADANIDPNIWELYWISNNWG